MSRLQVFSELCHFLSQLRSQKFNFSGYFLQVRLVTLSASQVRHTFTFLTSSTAAATLHSRVYPDSNYGLLNYLGRPRIVVAADGSGNFRTIRGAVARAPLNSLKPYFIHIRRGVCQDYVTINKPHIALVGEGSDVTSITGSRSVTVHDMENSTTVIIEAPRFMAINLTIENSSPQENGQAVALRISSDQSMLYRCAIRGNQDTLYDYEGRQFYKHCTITGTVDFLFGFAAAVFQSCNILSRNGATTVISAHGRNSTRDKTGFVFQFCRIARERDRFAGPKPPRNMHYAEHS
ncbi:probable pectinesterase 56 [Rutidosis leptorrhynchoides]|uniref:probable pectinesterase 56 n=1 Tax=Rutidosis leptorrhynchoides TaxID=125765 RepID=UPI003A9A6507